MKPSEEIQHILIHQYIGAPAIRQPSAMDYVQAIFDYLDKKYEEEGTKHGRNNIK